MMSFIKIMKKYLNTLSLNCKTEGSGIIDQFGFIKLSSFLTFYLMRAMWLGFYLSVYL